MNLLPLLRQGDFCTVIYKSQMNDSTIPNAVSYGDLQDAMKAVKAKSDVPTYDGFTEQELVSLSTGTLTEVVNKCSSPMITKVMALMILNGLNNWHHDLLERASEANDSDSIQQISHDMAQLRVAYEALRGVEVDAHDFTLGS